MPAPFPAARSSRSTTRLGAPAGTQGVRLCQSDARLFQADAERKRGVIICICGLGGEKLDFGYIAGAAGNASLMAFARAMGGTQRRLRRARARGQSRSGADRPHRLSREDPRPARARRRKPLHGELQRICPTAGRPMSKRSRRWSSFLASDHSSYISGTVVTIDAGIAHRSISAEDCVMPQAKAADGTKLYYETPGQRPGDHLRA